MDDEKTQARRLLTDLLDRVKNQPNATETLRHVEAMVNYLSNHDGFDPPTVISLLLTTDGLQNIHDLKQQIVALAMNFESAQLACETGLRQAARLDPAMILPLACDFLSGYDAWFRKVWPSDRRISNLVTAAGNLNEKSIQEREFLSILEHAQQAIRDRVQWVHPDSAIKPALEIFGAFSLHWETWLREDCGTWEKPWWWAVVNVYRLASNGIEELSGCGLTTNIIEVAYSWNNECIRQRICTGLADWLNRQIGPGPTFDRCGTPEAIAWMVNRNFRPAVRTESTSFSAFLGDVVLSKAGKLRTIEGYGIADREGPVYVIRVHETGNLDRKRLIRPKGSEVGYSAAIGRDTIVVSNLIAKPV